MAKTVTEIEIEENLLFEARKLFASLGLDLSEAIDLFFRECLYRGKLPFSYSPSYSERTLSAMNEAREIAKDQSAPRYSSMEELEKSLLAD